jgi:fatty-acyl-CoA synthase
MMAAVLQKRSFLHPHRLALVDGDRRLSYAELAQRSHQVALLLQQLGIQRGDRVAILSVNCAEWVELFFAAAELGVILVPLNWRLAPAELDYQLQDCGPRLLFVGPEQQELANRLQSAPRRIAIGSGEWGMRSEGNIVDPTELPSVATPQSSLPHLILYTSGTTGHPKGAVLTQANLFWNAINCSLAFGLSERDTTLTFLPLFHAGGIGLFTIPSLYVGGRVVLMRAFDAPHAVDLVRRESVNVLFGVPANWLELLKVAGFTAADCPSLRVLGSGGAPCPTAVIDRLAERGFSLLQGYGLTETAPGGTLLSPEDWRRKAGTVGKPMLHVELRVVDEVGTDLPPGQIGEVWFRGPNVFAGYWNNPTATAEAFSADGWFKSGDLGRLDEEGFLTLVDRKKDMIISGGENIYSAEVEDALFGHPSVAEAAVIGVPDERWGEVVRAIVALRPGAAASADELIEHCRAWMARYKCPRSVVFVDSLPRNASGKVLKAELRQRFAQEVHAL